MNALLFLLPAFCACVVLTGIHTYLGIHVIRRGVIFVDIALAQIAALGMTIAFVFGFEPESQISYFFALGFTFLGALFFAFVRNERLHQEAIIGISFATASALSILLADKIPHGSEHLKYILSGNILWVSWPVIIKTAIIYFLLGIFHYTVRHKLMLVSTKPEEAKRRGMKIHLWDLLFYLSFGLVITSSVQIGGILLVFAFLIVPASCAILFYDRLKSLIFFGWTIGLLTSIVSIAASYWYDLPTGPTIVTLFGIALIFCFVVKKIVR